MRGSSALDNAALYPAVPSTRAGGNIDLCVSTRLPRFRIALARAVDPMTPATISQATFEGVAMREGDAGRPWGWPLSTISAPELPGPYAAWIVAVDGAHGNAAHDARRNRALVIVRGTQRLPILVLVPTFTYQAYNVGVGDPASTDCEGRCLYTGAGAVTLARPGGGNGGFPWDVRNVDVYDRASPRQTFEHWDRKAIAWLEDRGAELDFASDLDLHTDPALLEGRALLLCFGHHEYWTQAMRARVEAFVSEGGNVAFFGGNSLWWAVRYDAETQSIARADPWAVASEKFIGVSYRYGGGQWVGKRTDIGFRVRSPGHWLFEKTGLRAGDCFGGKVRAVGYECDGTAPDFASRDRAIDEVARCSLERWRIGNGGELAENAHASIVVREAGGTIVSTSSVDWPRALWWCDSHVEQVTANVLERLGGVRLRERDRFARHRPLFERLHDV